MYMRVEKLERTDQSIPFNAADQQLIPIYLDHYSYIEEEYTYSNVANVYSYHDHGVHIKYSNAPYTNRFLLRKPIKNFSGRVIVEIFNSTNGWDVSPMWALLWKKILRDGDAYVGVSARGTCARSLQKFDAKRYASLSWKNPNLNPGKISQEILMWQQSVPEQEDGLVWDMITDLSNLLKSGEGTKILGNKAQYVYAIGCSQSSMLLTTYMNVFHRTTLDFGVHPSFDGYLTYSGGRMISLNQEEDPIANEEEISHTKCIGAHVIRIMSQWDFKDFAGHISLRRDDSDEKGDCFRLYEMACQPHNAFMGAFYRPGYGEIDKLEKKTDFPSWPMAHLPMEMFVDQALCNLDAWVSEGIAPPRSNRIEVDENNQEVLDDNGNCMGGFRFPQVEVPTGTYHIGNDVNPQESLFFPFTKEKLLSLYPTFRDYVYKIFMCVDDLCEKRFISREHADLMKTEILKEDVYKWM